jgi:hypothetical protein
MTKLKALCEQGEKIPLAVYVMRLIEEKYDEVCNRKESNHDSDSARYRSRY